MKLLSVKEVADKKQAQILKDIDRAKDTEETLKKVTSELEMAEAKFKLALSSQQVRWKQEEDEALLKIAQLGKEIADLEEEKKHILAPIEEREKKSYALFIEAEKALHEARLKQGEVEEIKKKEEEITDLLEEKLDSLSERESQIEDKEQKIIIREKSMLEEREMIKRLSSELSVKLQNLT